MAATHHLQGAPGITSTWRLMRLGQLIIGENLIMQYDNEWGHSQRGTIDGITSVCKNLDNNLETKYELMTTTHSYDQMIMDDFHRDLRRARVCACNLVPTPTSSTKVVTAVLPKHNRKLMASPCAPMPNVSMDLVVKVGK